MNRFIETAEICKVGKKTSARAARGPQSGTVSPSSPDVQAPLLCPLRKEDGWEGGSIIYVAWRDVLLWIIVISGSIISLEMSIATAWRKSILRFFQVC